MVRSLLAATSCSVQMGANRVKHCETLQSAEMLNSKANPRPRWSRTPRKRDVELRKMRLNELMVFCTCFIVFLQQNSAQHCGIKLRSLWSWLQMWHQILRVAMRSAILSSHRLQIHTYDTYGYIWIYILDTDRYLYGAETASLPRLRHQKHVQRIPELFVACPDSDRLCSLAIGTLQGFIHCSSAPKDLISLKSVSLVRWIFPAQISVAANVSQLPKSSQHLTFFTLCCASAQSPHTLSTLSIPVL